MEPESGSLCPLEMRDFAQFKDYPLRNKQFSVVTNSDWCLGGPTQVQPPLPLSSFSGLLTSAAVMPPTENRSVLLCCIIAGVNIGPIPIRTHYCVGSFICSLDPICAFHVLNDENEARVFVFDVYRWLPRIPNIIWLNAKWKCTNIECCLALAIRSV